MDVKQLYGRTDMIMLEQNNKIYGSLGIAEQTILKTEEGNPVILKDPKPGESKNVITDFKMQGWTEQPQYEGKNLFDKTKIEDTIDTTHTQTDTGIEVSGLYYVVYRASVAPNTDMRISYNKIGEGFNQVSVYGTDMSSDNLISSSYGTGMEFNTGKHTEILVLFYCSGGTENVSIYNDIMLNLGSTSHPYEHYTGGQPSPSPGYPQPITSAGKYNEDTQKWEYEITITNAQTDPDKEQTVTLTADRPLTKWDRLEKRNGQWGWVYKSGVKQLTSDMSIYKNLEGTYQVASFAKIDRNRLAESLSTHFIYKLSVEEYGNFWFDSVGTNLRFRMSQFNTAEEVKDWLQENEVYFAFPTTEETFAPLSESEQEAMSALEMYLPTTVITNDVDCSMIVTYKSTQNGGESE